MNELATSVETKPATRRGAKITKFTPRNQKAIVEAVAEGLPFASAAALAGVSKHTATDWLEKGENEPDGIFGKFAIEVRQKQAEYKLELLRKIREIGWSTNQWAALMTILERVYGDEFGKPKNDTNVNVNIGILEKRVHEIQAEGFKVYDGG